MNLADELRGIKPRITAPGRLILRDDTPGIEPFQPDLPRAIALAEWVKTAGRFTSIDAADAIGIYRGHASQYLTSLRRRGLVRKVGEEPAGYSGGKKTVIYEAVPEDKAEAAARKHFG